MTAKPSPVPEDMEMKKKVIIITFCCMTVECYL